MRDVPAEVDIDSEGGSYYWISEDHHLLFCGTLYGELYMVDFAAGQWLEPLHPPQLQSIEEVSTTPNYLLVAGSSGGYAFGPWHVYSLPDLKYLGVLGRYTCSANGEPYKNMVLLAAADGSIGVDLVSIRPEKVCRTYRLPPGQELPAGYSIAMIIHKNTLIVGEVYPPTDLNPRTGMARAEGPRYLLAWELETAKFMGRFSEDPRGSWGQFLDEHFFVGEHARLDNSLVQDFFSYHFAGDKVIACTDSGVETGGTVLAIYQLPRMQMLREIVIEGCEFCSITFSSKYFLLEIEEGFILVKWEDLLAL